MNLNSALSFTLLLALSTSAGAQESIRSHWSKIIPPAETDSHDFSGFEVGQDGSIYYIREESPTRREYQLFEIAKLDPSGAQVWLKRDRDYTFRRLMPDRDGRLYVDHFPELAKIDADGTELWRVETLSEPTYAYSRTSDLLFSATSFVNLRIAPVSTDTGAVRSGYTESIPTATRWGSLHCVDDSGTTYYVGSWHNRFDEAQPTLWKVTGGSKAYSRPLHNPGSFHYDIDSFEGSCYVLDVVHTGPDLFTPVEFSRVTKLSPDGTIEWVRQMPKVEARDFAVDRKTGAVYVAGPLRDGDYGPLRVFAYDRKGTALWNVTLPANGDSRTFPHIETDRYGRIYVSDSLRSSSSSTARAYAFQPSGQSIWNLVNSFHPYTTAFRHGVDHKGRFILSGRTKQNWTTDHSLWIASYLQAPLAVNDNYRVTANQPLVVPAPGVKQNDQYAEDATLIKVAGPANGSLQLAPDGGFTYTVKPGFNGTDTFTYYLDNGLKSNTATVSINVQIPWLKSINLAKTTIIGGDGTHAGVTLAAPGASPSTVSLSSNSTAIQVPPTVEVQQGSQSAAALVKTSPVSATATRVISASLDGVTKTANLTLTPGGLTRNTISPSSVTGGGTATGTITLSGPAPAGGRVVTLTSNSSTIVVPSSVTVPAGSATATYTVQTHPTGGLARQVTARLGVMSQVANLTVLAPRLSSLTISPNSVQGGTSTTGTVTLNGPASANRTTIFLGSNSSFVVVPSFAYVAPGTSSKTFTINTKPVTATATRQVTATQGGSVTFTANITLTP